MPSAAPRTARAVALLALTALLLVLGARMAFLCDDAFITFRYVANAHAGHGLVWNPPPFRPVEGYTGFLWALLLWATWSWTGVEPPASAHVWSMAFGVVQFATVAAGLFALRRRDGARWPDGLVFLALLTVVTNRTFLQWLTSGLETALFHAGVLAWVVLAFRGRERRHARWLALWSSAAAVAALTRPDGLLFVVATVVVAAIEALRRRLPPRRLAALLPLAAVLLHVGWRRVFYGEWLPNTYYAKVGESWPAAGLRYLACFVFEHGTWVAVGAALVWLAVELRAARAFAARLAANVPAVAATGAVLAQVGYYTLVVGGDHFEYRVFAHLVPLSVLALVAIAGRLGWSPRMACVWLAVSWLASGVGWLHAWVTRDLQPHGFRALAEAVPAPLRPVFAWYDRQQIWLRVRLIGIRCSEHAQFLGDDWRAAPVRLATAGEPFPVAALSSVGWPGWLLRDTAIVDELGLNDWVVARTPAAPVDPRPMQDYLAASFDAVDVDRSGGLDLDELQAALRATTGGAVLGADMQQALVASVSPLPAGGLDRAAFAALAPSVLVVRKMAHEHHPPDGYVDGLRPNVAFTAAGPVATPRDVPLTADEIRRHEAAWWARIAARR